MVTPSRSTTAPDPTNIPDPTLGTASAEPPEKATTGHVIDDELLAGAIKDCEAIVEDEQAGRSDFWPSSAAIAYWNNAQTLRRFLTTPHLPDGLTTT
ncbi:hypothetical protein [Arthrobacter rhombi]|uniref:hypothetical protein n=1 Tax=Arthrobacter rhombi TaxID=71253 RepID=UPI003FCF88ED